MKAVQFVFIILIIFITFYAYNECVNNSFVYDDHYFVEKNLAIRSLKNIPRFFLDPIHTNASTEWKGIYRPLRTTSYALEYKLYRLDPGGYHLTNLMLHIINVVLTFIFVNLLTSDKRISIITTLLFAIHPAYSEAVLWIGSRADLLLGFFELLTIITFILFIRTGNKKYYVWTIFNFILALLCKETAIVTPVIFLAISKAMGKKPKRKTIILPFVIAFIYLPVRIYLMQGFAQREWWGGSFINNFLTAIKLISHYIYLLIFPYHLSVDYGIKPVQSLFDLQLIISTFIIIVVLWLSYKWVKTKKSMQWLGVVWFFLFLAPALNFIPITTITGDRFLYLSCIGIFMSIASIIFSFKTKQAKTIFLLLLLMLSATYVITIKNRTREWNNDYSLFSSVLKYNPNSWMSYQDLGTLHYQIKDYKNAHQFFLKALSIRNDHPLTYKSLGLIALETGHVDEAQKYFLKALLLNPGDSEIGNLVAITFDIQKRYDVAKQLYKRYLEIDPQNHHIKTNMEKLYRKLKKSKTSSLQTEQQQQ